MTVSKRFTGFGLLSEDVNRMKQFYKDILEAEVEESNIYA